MTKNELLTIIERVVNEGLGYDAIRILSNLLEKQSEITAMSLREVDATKIATLKYCGSNISNKRKVEIIRDLWDSERRTDE